MVSVYFLKIPQFNCTIATPQCPNSVFSRSSNRFLKRASVFFEGVLHRMLS